MASAASFTPLENNRTPTLSLNTELSTNERIAAAVAAVAAASMLYTVGTYAYAKLKRRVTSFPFTTFTVRLTFAGGAMFPSVYRISISNTLWQTSTTQESRTYTPRPDAPDMTTELLKKGTSSTLLHSFPATDPLANPQTVLIAMPSTKHNYTGELSKNEHGDPIRDTDGHRTYLKKSTTHAQGVTDLYERLDDRIKENYKVVFYYPQLNVQPSGDSMYEAAHVSLIEQEGVIGDVTEAVLEKAAREGEEVTLIFSDVSCYVDPATLAKTINAHQAPVKTCFLPNFLEKNRVSQFSKDFFEGATLPLFLPTFWYRTQNPSVQARFNAFNQALSPQNKAIYCYARNVPKTVPEAERKKVDTKERQANLQEGLRTVLLRA